MKLCIFVLCAIAVVSADVSHLFDGGADDGYSYHVQVSNEYLPPVQQYRVLRSVPEVHIAAPAPVPLFYNPPIAPSIDYIAPAPVPIPEYHPPAPVIHSTLHVVPHNEYLPPIAPIQEYHPPPQVARDYLPPAPLAHIPEYHPLPPPVQVIEYDPPASLYEYLPPPAVQSYEVPLAAIPEHQPVVPAPEYLAPPVQEYTLPAAETGGYHYSIPDKRFR